MLIGGGSGIRTHGADEGTTVFKTVTINQTLPSLLFMKPYSKGFPLKYNAFHFALNIYIRILSVAFLGHESFCVSLLVSILYRMLIINI